MLARKGRLHALILLFAWNVCAFNLSPRPNKVFTEPQLATFMPKVRVSYFGYTISLRPNG